MRVGNQCDIASTIQSYDRSLLVLLLPYDLDLHDRKFKIVIHSFPAFGSKEILGDTAYMLSRFTRLISYE
jgi:hypothetical protein